MNLTKFDWKLRKQDNLESIIEELRQSGRNFSDDFLRLAALRGIKTTEDLLNRTNPEPQLFHDPYLMYDMDKAIERIQRAVENNERILIYGDYDADGITSTLILYEGLEMVGADVHYYLPNRLTDGYGPNEERWLALKEEWNIDLIITCDNGVTGHQPVERMKAEGIDVIITDHHEIQADLPDAYAVIHPNHPKGEYPFKDLSGAGVALKVTSALLEEIVPEALELAAIGTVADMVSLTDENRTIVLSGLNLMKSSQRIGLRMLLEEEKVQAHSIDTETIGFIIGPRLNAVGRLGDASPGLELLKTFDSNEARELLKQVNQANRQRQELTSTIVTELEERLADLSLLPNIILEAGENWPAGVLGIVASRLVNKYQRPAIIFQYDADLKQYKGSARSVASIDLFQELYPLKNLMLKFGGHSQAAGLTVEEDNWSAFCEALKSRMEAFTEQLALKESLDIDMQLSPDAISLEFIEEVSNLAPFGMDNPKPVFLFDQIAINQIRFIGSEQTHLKFSFAKSNKEWVQAIGFSKADLARGIQDGEEISFVGELNINQWNGNVSPQVQITDLGQKGIRWLDYRASEIHPDLFTLNNSVYVFAHKSIARQMKSRINETNKVLIFKEFAEQDLSTFENLVLMEPPAKLNQLEDLLTASSWSHIYLGSFIAESKFLAGSPSRQELIQFYQFLKKYKEIDFTKSSQQLTNQLNLPLVKLKLMILMFSEAKFVTMENGGLIKFNEEQSGKVDLTTLSSYVNYQEALETEKFLNYQPIDKIKKYFERNWQSK